MNHKAFETVWDAFAYLESFTNLERGTARLREYRIERMIALSDGAGRPQDSFASVHIAGSKGKGSTATYLAAIIDAAQGPHSSQNGSAGRGSGHVPVGLYLSPHIVDYRERISDAGRIFPDEVYISEIASVRDYVDSIRPTTPEEELPSTFELLTLLAFRIFTHTGCRHAVLETGMGGRLDATNVVAPVVSVITPIELEHTEYLGDTIPLIAGEKAGIIKPDTPVVTGLLVQDAMQVMRQRAKIQNSPLIALSEELVSLESQDSTHGTDIELRYRDGLEISSHLKLIGAAQAQNAALAALVAHRVLKLDKSVIEAGLAQAWLPGRMEVLQEAPLLVVDGAHTPNSIERTLQSFLAVASQQRCLVFGAVSGKRFRPMMELLAPHFDEVIIARPGTFKPSDPDALFREFSTLHESVRLIPDIDAALTSALQEGDVLVTGSFYLAAEARDHHRARKDTVS